MTPTEVSRQGCSPILLQGLSMQSYRYPTTVLGLGLIEVDITVLLWKVSKGTVVPVWFPTVFAVWSPMDAVGNDGTLEIGPRVGPEGHWGVWLPMGTVEFQPLPLCFIP